eukprot:3167022-Prymnesium_polylepis.1
MSGFEQEHVETICAKATQYRRGWRPARPSAGCWATCVGPRAAHLGGWGRTGGTVRGGARPAFCGAL